MSQRFRQVPSLSLSVLRLTAWAIFVLGLSVAPGHLNHVPAKYMGEAAGLALDLSLDTEPEELDGDGAVAPWFAANEFSPTALTPLLKTREETGSRLTCVRAPLPARGPPGQV